MVSREGVWRGAFVQVFFIPGRPHSEGPVRYHIAVVLLRRGRGGGSGGGGRGQRGHRRRREVVEGRRRRARVDRRREGLLLLLLVRGGGGREGQLLRGRGRRHGGGGRRHLQRNGKGREASQMIAVGFGTEFQYKRRKRERCSFPRVTMQVQRATDRFPRRKSSQVTKQVRKRMSRRARTDGPVHPADPARARRPARPSALPAARHESCAQCVGGDEAGHIFAAGSKEEGRQEGREGRSVGRRHKSSRPE